MKKRIFLSIVILVLAGALFYLSLLLPIATGYSAKNLASGIFLAERSQESMEREDLNFSIVKYVKNTVDKQNRSVTSRLLWSKSTAIYMDGYGCILVRDYPEDEIRGRNYPKVDVLPENPDTIPWPKGDLIADTIPEGIHAKKLEEVVLQAMADTIPFKGTFALMVIYKGQPVAEIYRDDFDRNSRFLSWSVAKSITNAITGLMVRDGLIDIHKPVAVEEWTKDKRASITISNLLRMNSGLEWNETYGNLSDVTAMLYKISDMGKYTAEKPAEAPADSIWIYSSGTTNLVCKILRNSFFNDTEYHKYPREALFNKTGMRSAVFEMDASGTFVGSSYLYATMRDYARFGLLYLNQGIWDGEQLLPEDWVKYTTTTANGSEGQYGAFFWLNKSGDLPDLPRDTYLCKGHNGQYIVIIPSKELIVVRTGYSKSGEFDLNKLVQGILASIE